MACTASSPSIGVHGVHSVFSPYMRSWHALRLLPLYAFMECTASSPPICVHGVHCVFSLYRCSWRSQRLLPLYAFMACTASSPPICVHGVHSVFFTSSDTEMAGGSQARFAELTETQKMWQVHSFAVNTDVLNYWAFGLFHRPIKRLALQRFESGFCFRLQVKNGEGGVEG
jgi:hypothetical protein